MGDVVNLNKFRKKKTRNRSEIQAAENRVKFGRRKEQKIKDRLTEEKKEKLLSGKKITRHTKQDDNPD